ncbi:sensor domain-containing diguanylate cyclase [Alishewanella longhuensis]
MNTNRLDSRFQELQDALSPLMQLVCSITALETAFVTYIDPVLARQQVAVVYGNGEINIVAGTDVPWQDSMCRQLFNDDSWLNDNIAESYPRSVGAKLGMTTFFALPVQHNEQLIGSLCGASKHQQTLSASQLQQLELIATAVSWLIAKWQRLIKLQQRLLFTQQRLKQAYQDRESLKQLAEQDPLTGLLNRRGFADLWQSCTEQDLTDGDIAVIALDFDNFKQLNDNFGHQAGDEALIAIAQILLQSTRDYDFASRLGGDEFVLVLPGCKRLEALQIAERIQQSYTASQHGKYHSISMGVAISSVGAADDLLLLADKALYKAKNSGRGQLVVKTFRP